MKTYIGYMAFLMVALGLQPSYSAATNAQKFTGVAHIVPYGDVTINASRLINHRIDGKYEFTDTELNALLISKVLPKKVSKDGLVIRLKTNKALWDKFMLRVKNLEKPLTLKFSDGSSLTPYFVIDKYPISLSKKTTLYQKGDSGVFTIKNNSNIPVTLGALQGSKLPKEIMVYSDHCSLRKIRSGKSCDVILSLQSEIKYFKTFDVSFSSGAPNKNRLIAHAAANISSNEYSFPSLPVGAPVGEYVSSCSNIYYSSPTITADCTYWNGSSFVVATGKSINASACSNGVRSDPFSGNLVCNPPSPRPNPNWIPQGTYLQNCLNIEINSNNVLTAECANNYGSVTSSSLDYSKCLGAPVANKNGSLVCPELNSSIESDNPFTFSPPKVSNPNNVVVQDIGNFEPWSNVASQITQNNPNNPAFSTGVNSSFEVDCSGLNSAYSVNFYQPDSTKVILYGYGPFKGDKRTICPGSAGTTTNGSGDYFTGSVETIYYNHGNTFRGCDLSKLGRIGLSYGNGFVSNEAFWDVGNMLYSGLQACNQTQSVVLGSQKINLPAEQWQVTTVGGDYPSAGGIQLITPGSQYYPAYGLFFKNSTSNAITIQAKSITTTYCQNQPKWESGLYVFGEALSLTLAAYSPSSASPIVDGISAEVSGETGVISTLQNPPSCSAGQPSAQVQYPSEETTIPSGQISYIGGAVLDNFDYFLQTTYNDTKVPVTVNHALPITYNDGWHALFLSLEKNCTFKISALSDLKHFSPINSVVATGSATNACDPTSN